MALSPEFSLAKAVRKDPYVCPVCKGATGIVRVRGTAFRGPQHVRVIHVPGCGLFAALVTKYPNLIGMRQPADFEAVIG